MPAPVAGRPLTPPVVGGAAVPAGALVVPVVGAPVVLVEVGAAVVEVAVVEVVLVPVVVPVVVDVEVGAAVVEVDVDVVGAEVVVEVVVVVVVVASRQTPPSQLYSEQQSASLTQVASGAPKPWVPQQTPLSQVALPPSKPAPLQSSEVEQAPPIGMPRHVPLLVQSPEQHCPSETQSIPRPPQMPPSKQSPWIQEPAPPQWSSVTHWTHVLLVAAQNSAPPQHST